MMRCYNDIQQFLRFSLNPCHSCRSKSIQHDHWSLVIDQCNSGQFSLGSRFALTPWDGQRGKISELRSVQECLSVQEWLSFRCLDKAEQGKTGQNTFGQDKARTGRARALTSLTPHLQSVPSSVGRHFLNVNEDAAMMWRLTFS